MSIALSPPGPKQRLLSGNLADFHRGRLDFLTHCARNFGDVVGLRLGPRRLFLINHPDLIEQVLVTKNASFRKHFALRLNPLVFGQGLLTSEGDFWLKQRRLIQPAFLRARIASYAADMVAATQNMLAGWRIGETREMYGEMMRLTLAITVKTLFGAVVDGAAVEVGEALRFLQENFLKRFDSLFVMPLWMPTPQNLRVRAAVQRLDKILYGFIQQRRDAALAGSSANATPQAAGNDLLSMLLHMRDESDGSQMSDRQIRDEAMTLFLAGHETTALALTWTWYLLSRNPEVEEQVSAELRRVVGDRLPTFDDVPKLTCLDQVLHESMRLFPPVYVIGREALADCEIAGYHVPRGTTLLMSEWVVHRDARFFPEPEVFRPSRWTPEFHKQLPKFAYFPFGGGPRVCIGNTFAMMEMTLVLATIAQRYRFTLEPGQIVEPAPSFTLRPRNGVMAPIVARDRG